MNTLFYCPLESYPERYTFQMSRPVDGWVEAALNKYQIKYVRLDADENTANIESGSVLDVQRRSHHCLSQSAKVVDTFVGYGTMTGNDVLYFEDMWHPGIEALAYASGVMKLPLPKVYTFCWAQSVDRHDFTHKMQPWMRHYEKMIGSIVTGIFVATPLIKELLFTAGIADWDKIHVVGLPFSTSEVMNHFRPEPVDRKKKVVFSSRFDEEKNPHFMLDVAQHVLMQNHEYEFVCCSSAKNFRTSVAQGHALQNRFIQMADKFEGFKLKLGLTKADYYQELREAWVQLNTADQDWVSFTLLEACAAGTYPLYPNYRSFPEVFDFNQAFMYAKGNVLDCASKINALLANDTLYASHNRQRLCSINTKHDTTILRMLDIMGFGKSFLNEYFPRWIYDERLA
jgi:glycosyltransferase involved in cell wall biosynthesis